MYLQYRNTLKQLLVTFLYISTLSLLIKLIDAISTQKFQNDITPKMQCTRQCNSSTCLSEASHFKKIMNDQVDPCSNFYEFVCGNFIKEKKIDDDLNVINTISLAQNKITEDMFSELSSEIDESDLEAFKKTKIYYQNCINESRIEEKGTQPLIEIINNIGGWPILLGNAWNESGFNWIDSIYKVKEQKYLVFFPVIISVQPDNNNSTQYSIKVHNAYLTINRGFFIDGYHKDLLKAYLDLMINVVTILGAPNNTDTLKDMQEVLDFEVSLYNLTTPEEKLLDIAITENQISIGDLSSKYPNIPWLELFNKVLNPSDIFINETEKVYIIDPKFVSGVAKLIDATPKRVLANFLAWRVTQLSLTYMPNKLKNAENDFASVLEGTKEHMNRETLCYNEVMLLFSVSTSAIFVRKYFDESTKDVIFEMFENIKYQTRRNLLEVEWMDNDTRKAALEKIDTMNVTVGFAKELLDDGKVNNYYKDLEITPGLYLPSAFNISSFLEKQIYKNLKLTSNSDRWASNRNIAVINAYNIFQENKIEIPAGFLRAFFKLNRPQYINYGTAGTVIGHEVTHAFDNQGRQYDKYGNQKNWFKGKTAENFAQKAQCIIEQYNNYTVPEVNLTVNGELTQGENIADNGGFKIAYHAYNEWVKRNNVVEECLPSLNYTPQQMFWISAASNWCSKQRPEYLREIISTDAHSPSDSRVIISFSNIKEFADDFGCKIGSRMNPEKKCLVW